MNEYIDKFLIDPVNNFLARIAVFLPSLLVAVLIFIGGIILAFLVEAATQRVLSFAGINRYAERWGFVSLMRKWGLKHTPSEFAGWLVFWLFIVLFLILSLGALNITELNLLISRFFMYLPNLFVAIAILVGGYILSNFLARASLVWAVNADIRMASGISKLVKLSVMLVVLTMALEQLGVGSTTVLLMFAILFGGMVLALAIAFGLGGRGIAREFLEKRLAQSRRDKNNIDPL